ncbi:MAG TPA: pantetheine-phosphate adenylyltransferase, partial [Stenomitos sp.]
GHLDLIERASRLFERLIVAVALNPNKSSLFTVQQRMDQIHECTQHLANIEIDCFDTLTVTYAQCRRAQVLLRGLRVLSDFEYELQMAHTNHSLSQDIETVFLATSNEYSFLSSSLVKEIAKFGGPVDHLVPQNVAVELERCYAKNPPSALKTTPMDPSLKTDTPTIPPNLPKV